MRSFLPAVLTLISTPLQAADGVLVWHDDAAMAVKLALLAEDDPAQVTALHVLAETRTISETMTAVSADGMAIGLCHQIRDGNESPARLTGYDRRGREIWQLPRAALHAGIEAALPEGQVLASPPDWLTFSCEDGGAGGAPAVLAFDIGVSIGGVSIGARDAGGFVPDPHEARIRLHLDGLTGALLAAAPLRKGGLPMIRPNRDRLRHTADGAVVMDSPAYLVLPEGGQGQALWGDRAIRWQGAPVGQGHDFAWFIPALE